MGNNLNVKQLRRDTGEYISGAYPLAGSTKGSMFSDLETVDLLTVKESQKRLDIVLEQDFPLQLDIMLEQAPLNPAVQDAANDPILESKDIEEVDGRIADLFDRERDCPGSQTRTNDALYDDEFMTLDGEIRDSVTQFQLAQTLQPGSIKTWGPRLFARICMQLAKKGSASAQHRLGCMYAQGSGVEQNYLMAYLWCKVSALQHLPKASLKLEEIESHLTDEHVFYATKLSKRYYDKYVAPFSH